MRAFIALDIPDDARAALGSLSARLQTGLHFSGARISWVQPQNMHFTLKFLGNEVDDAPEHVAALGEVMTEAVTGIAPFDAHLTQLGCFPNSKRPKVVWVALRQRDARPIEVMADRLGWRLERLGYAPEDRPFKPHLTLGRFRSLKGSHALPELLRSHRQFAEMTLRFDHLTLYESDLSSGSPVYRERLRVEFPATEPAAAPPPESA